MNRLTHLSLFSGIGGLDLAADWAGFETIGQVEVDPFCIKVLSKHWPNVKRWGGVEYVTADKVRKVCTDPITLISGGFPCQPFSSAGSRRGSEDYRNLWPEMLRIIGEIRPSWVVAENVANIINMALDDISADLEAIGYEVEPIVFPAGGVGALHERQRCFTVAYSERGRRDGIHERIEIGYVASDSGNGREDVSNGQSSSPHGRGVERNIGAIQGKQRTRFEEISPDSWRDEPRMGRVVDGVSGGVDRRRVLGNSVVPQQALPIFRAIAEIERSLDVHSQGTPEEAKQGGCRPVEGE